MIFDHPIGGRFAVERVAGEGGMGTVYLARDLASGEPVAVKVLQREDAPDIERFEREAHVLAELRHPSIVRYVTHGTTENGAPYLVMEWLDGESLEERLAKSTLSLAESVELAGSVA